MLRFKLLSATLLFLSYFSLVAQQWGDYTFYSTQNGSTGVLLDTNGNTFKTWNFGTSNKTGYSSYIVPGGTVVRTVMGQNSTFQGGGVHGKVQKYDYSGNMTWNYSYSSSTYCIHHDICPMPNGNVLMISYDLHTAAEATQAGCSQNIIIWSEKIIEVQPTGATTGTIVWEWKLWDHLCQNNNSAKDNYVTSIVQNPQLININYSTSKDWIHMNGIDYNPVLDQISVSSHNLNEIWVIDHSTTTAQAAGHTGGNSGKGGDILYRWGNPAAYGATGTKIFNVVHDAHWIPENCPRAGQLSAFNNLGGTNNKSAVDVIEAPLYGYNYNITLGQAYTPSASTWRHNSAAVTTNEGNSQHLPNGNVMVCIAKSGYFYEIDSNQNILWSKTISGTASQVFRYNSAYIQGVNGVDILAKDTIICSGDSIQLTASEFYLFGINTFAWSSTAGSISSTSRKIYVKPTTTTTYTVTMNDGTTNYTKSITIYLSQQPATPTISLSGNSLVSSSSTNNQWYFNGAIISGATSQNYTPTQTGDYTVQVMNGGCSSSISAPYYMAYSSISSSENQSSSFSIYPNPTDGFIKLETTGLDVSTTKIYNTTGALIGDFGTETSIDLTNQNKGVYFVELTLENGTKLCKKLIINN